MIRCSGLGVMAAYRCRGTILTAAWCFRSECKVLTLAFPVCLESRASTFRSCGALGSMQPILIQAPIAYFGNPTGMAP